MSFPDQGNLHVQTVNEPIAPYNSEPPTSGPHLPYVAPWGVHTEPIPKQLQVHNLEDGGVVVQYHCPRRCPELVDKLTAIVKRYDRQVVLAPYPGMKHRIAADGLDAPRRLRRVRRGSDRAASSAGIGGSTTTRGRMRPHDRRAAARALCLSCAAAVVALGALAGCARPFVLPLPPPPFRDQVPAAYDATWRALIRALAAENVPLRTVARDSGVIASDDIISPIGVYADCGRLGAVALEGDALVDLHHVRPAQRLRRHRRAGQLQDAHPGLAPRGHGRA